MEEIKLNTSEKEKRSVGYHKDCTTPKYAKKMEDFQKIFGLNKIVSKNLEGHFIIKGHDYMAGKQKSPNDGDIHIACDNCLELFKKDGVVV
jgi:hypothetical protein